MRQSLRRGPVLDPCPTPLWGLGCRLPLSPQRGATCNRKTLFRLQLRPGLSQSTMHQSGCEPLPTEVSPWLRPPPRPRTVAAQDGLWASSQMDWTDRPHEQSEVRISVLRASTHFYFHCFCCATASPPKDKTVRAATVRLFGGQHGKDVMKRTQAVARTCSEIQDSASQTPQVLCLQCQSQRQGPPTQQGCVGELCRRCFFFVTVFSSSDLLPAPLWGTRRPEVLVKTSRCFKGLALDPGPCNDPLPRPHFSPCLSCTIGRSFTFPTSLGNSYNSCRVRIFWSGLPFPSSVYSHLFAIPRFSNCPFSFSSVPPSCLIFDSG